MGWKNQVMEIGVGCASLLSKPFMPKSENIKSIFILRNNGLGDLLCTTPLFQALHNHYPSAKITLGIGDWHQDLIEGNPYIHEIIRINAPWHNQFKIPNSFLDIVSYIMFSREAKGLGRKKFDLGIDVLGSQWGSLLLIRCKIPFRLGVRGYAGGYRGTNRYIEFDSETHVGRASLKMGELVGTKKTGSLKPQLYLTKNELESGQSNWKDHASPKIIIAPGGSFSEKCWPIESYKELVELLCRSNIQIILLGGNDDVQLGKKLELLSANIINLIGKKTLRESCSIVATSDLIISNSSFLMHVAAAYDIPNYVLLGDWYNSAELHKKQWGHSNTYIFGRETDKNFHNLIYPEDIFQKLDKHFNLNTINITK